jgi:hypothetical protein
MIDLLRRRMMVGFTSVLSGRSMSALVPECPIHHTDWVAGCLKRMLTVQPGMTRAQLMQVFTTEGGLVFSALQQTFVSRECPFFKVEVRFDRAPKTSAGALEELTTDVIASVSRPYLQFTVAD